MMLLYREACKPVVWPGKGPEEAQSVSLTTQLAGPVVDGVKESHDSIRLAE